MKQFNFNLVSDIILSNTLYFSKKDYIYDYIYTQTYICIDMSDANTYIPSIFM